MSVTVQTGRYAEPRTYHVQLARHPKLLSSLVLSVLSNAVDTEGDLPEELTAHLSACLTLDGHDPITLKDTVSGARFSGPMGPMALFGPISSLVGILARNGFEPVRLTSIDCEVTIDTGRTTAAIESLRLASDRVAPGETLKALVTLRPFQSDPEMVELSLPLPSNLPEGNYEAVVCDASTSLRRRVSGAPHQAEPRDLDGLLSFLRVQSELKRTGLFLHVPRPDRGLAVEGQSLPSLPASARAVLNDTRQTAPSPVRPDWIQAIETKWVVEGSQSLKFQVVKDTAVSLRE
jgi:hypothetical protein